MNATWIGLLRIWHEKIAESKSHFKNAHITSTPQRLQDLFFNLLAFILKQAVSVQYKRRCISKFRLKR